MFGKRSDGYLVKGIDPVVAPPLYHAHALRRPGDVQIAL